MNKRELEERVLELVKPLLIKLYGEFTVDPNQTDKPDAAIYINKPHKRFGINRTGFRVGVEITTLDEQQALRYLNDPKFGREVINEQIKKSLEHGIDEESPNKKINVEIPYNYIYSGVKEKSEKYSSYADSGDFREIILVCFSNIVGTENASFKDAAGLRNWTNFLLSESNFPFEKVLFVDLLGGVSVRIFEKRKPMTQSPEAYKYSDASITVAQGHFMRFGKTYNINNIFSKDPLIPPRNKSPKKPKNSSP